MKHPLKTCALVVSATVTALLTTGCGVQSAPLAAASASVASSPTTVTFKGRLMGGQQPIAGASVYLYGVAIGGYSGYGQGASASYGEYMSTFPAVTASDGTFNLTSRLECNGDVLVYIVGTGGNSGSGTNSNLSILSALGYCDQLTSTTNIQVNELTTVATVYALAPFMQIANTSSFATSSALQIGAPVSNLAGLALAFASVNQLVNTATGTVPGPNLPANATLDTTKLNSLADILAACINSTGGVAGDTSPCGKLFTAATPPGGTAPTDTATALLNIVQFPSNNVSALFNLLQAQAVYVPTLTAIPNDWTLTATYAPAGLSSPSSLGIDSSGDVWIASKGDGSVVALTNSGAVLSTSSPQGLNTPVTIALDTNGIPWVGDSASSSLLYLSPSGASVVPAGTGGLNAPSGIALDPRGNVWISDQGANSVTVLNSSGASVSGSGYSGAGINKPLGIALSTH